VFGSLGANIVDYILKNSLFTAMRTQARCMLPKGVCLFVRLYLVFCLNGLIYRLNSFIT